MVGLVAICAAVRVGGCLASRLPDEPAATRRLRRAGTASASPTVWSCTADSPPSGTAPPARAGWDSDPRQQDPGRNAARSECAEQIARCVGDLVDTDYSRNRAYGFSRRVYPGLPNRHGRLTLRLSVSQTLKVRRSSGAQPVAGSAGLDQIGDLFFRVPQDLPEHGNGIGSEQRTRILGRRRRLG